MLKNLQSRSERIKHVYNRRNNPYIVITAEQHDQNEHLFKKNKIKLYILLKCDYLKQRVGLNMASYRVI